MIAPWHQSTLEALAARAPFGPNGRVRLGLAFDLFWMPKAAIAPLLDAARALSPPLALLTGHDVPRFWSPDATMVERAADHGYLDGSVLMSHCCSAAPGGRTSALLREAGAHVSCTPSTELQMGLGRPLALDDRHAELQSQLSLGIDCHANQSASIVGEMRILLQSARGFRNEEIAPQAKAVMNLRHTCEQVFNLGTLGGARGAKMEGQIGSIKEGMLADLVLFDALSPSMVCGAQQDPVSAIVLHSSPGDIVDVMVDGVFRKRDGRLVPIQPEGEEAIEILGQDQVTWSTVARALVDSKTKITEQAKKIDYDQVKKTQFQMYGWDDSTFAAY
jgi:hypothetical protein